MTDRELLELAAKAAGHKLDDETSVYHDEYGRIWNPLTDDGDALRLAVKLKLDISFRATFVKAGEFPEYAIETYKFIDGGDRPEATRRAIVRAAAEIGKSVK